jgi:hypothetical protein
MNVRAILALAAAALLGAAAARADKEPETLDGALLREAPAVGKVLPERRS